MMTRLRFLILFIPLTILFANEEEGEKPVAFFKVGMFDQQGIQAFLQQNPGLEGEPLNEALTTHLRALAIANETPFIFFHNTAETTPFIYQDRPVEVVVMNEALGEPAPAVEGSPPTPPAEAKIGLVQIQHLLDQILGNERIQQEMNSQFQALDGVPQLMEEVTFYDNILQKIEEDEMEDDAVRRKYGMTVQELTSIGAQSYQRLQMNRRSFTNQFAEFYVSLILNVTFAEAEETAYTHVFQLMNGPTRRIAFSNGSITDITQGVAERLNDPENFQTPSEADLPSAQPE